MASVKERCSRFPTYHNDKLRPTEVKTERLLLRGARSTDYNAFHMLFSDSEAMTFWTGPPHTSITKSIKYVDAMIASPQNGVTDFAVCLLPPPRRCDGTTKLKVAEPHPEPLVIGKAGIWRNNESGFIFNRAYWGKGYADEALRAVIKRFRERGGAKIKADVDPRNEKCLKLLVKLGFVVVGTAKATFHTHLGWCDSVYLELPSC